MIAVGIVGHVDRTHLILPLVDKVDPQYVSMDDGTRGCFLNHHRVWRALLNDTGAEWLVVLEDDAVPVQCFRDQLQQALDVAPTPVVSLYLGRDRPRFMQPTLRSVVEREVDACWLLTDHVLHAVGLAVHRTYVGKMLKHTREVPGAALLPIDRAIGHWIKNGDNDIQHVSYAWPSLVDHADQGSVIDVHPDGLPRDRVLYLDEGMPWPVLSKRVAWRAGVRAQWDSSSYVLG